MIDPTFHCAAFFASVLQNASYQQLLAVADSALTRNAANQYIAPDNIRVTSAHVQGITTSRAQIQAPSLRNLAFPEIYPIVQSVRTALPDMAGIRIYKDNGPRILMNEGFSVNASENNTGASATNAMLTLARRWVPAPPGQYITLVATSTIVLVDSVWTLGTLAFETSLPAGEFLVVGASAIMDNANYFRLAFPGASGWRPGAPVFDVYGDKDWLDAFRVGNHGAWGSFLFNNPPQVEVFGAAAGSTLGTFLIDVLKVN